jgi:hypothetical protein
MFRREKCSSLSELTFKTMILELYFTLAAIILKK